MPFGRVMHCSSFPAVCVAPPTRSFFSHPTLPSIAGRTAAVVVQPPFPLLTPSSTTTYSLRVSVMTTRWGLAVATETPWIPTHRVLRSTRCAARPSSGVVEAKRRTGRGTRTTEPVGTLRVARATGMMGSREEVRTYSSSLSFDAPATWWNRACEAAAATSQMSNSRLAVAGGTTSRRRQVRRSWLFAIRAVILSKVTSRWPAVEAPTS